MAFEYFPRPVRARWLTHLRAKDGKKPRSCERLHGSLQDNSKGDDTVVVPVCTKHVLVYIGVDARHAGQRRPSADVAGAWDTETKCASALTRS